MDSKMHMFRKPLATSLVLIVSSLLTLAPAEADEELRPITHEDIWLMKRLGTPVVSPDGAFAVVNVTQPAYEEDSDKSDLWLLDVTGKNPPRQLTATAEGESGVVWSNDGTRIAFSAKRGKDEVSQVYVLNMDGPGEAIAITSLSTGAGNPKWSPDDKLIAFESTIYPGAMDDEANQAEKKARDERKINVSSYEIFPVRQWDRWRDDLQVHLFVQDAVTGASARNLLAGTKLVGKTGYSGTPTRSGSTLNIEWAPNGESLVFNASTNLDDAAHARVNYHLYQVPVTGGEPRALTSGDHYSCRNPRFSSASDFVYCLYRPDNDHVYNLTQLARLPWSGDSVNGDPQILTREFDRSVSGMEFSSNGRTLYMTANDAGRSRIFRMDASGGEVRTLNPESRGVYSGLQAANGGLLARWESSATPAEIVRIDTKNGRHSALSSFNTERAKGLDRPPFLEFWFESSRGRRVHNWLSLPAGFDASKKYPLVLQIHGGPFSSSMDSSHVRWSAGLQASPGYVVLMTDYTGSVGYGEQFSRNIQRDPLKTPADEILEAARVAIERYPFIDGDRQAATGASYGGHLVNWLQGTTDHFKALVGHAGLVDLEGQYSSSDTIYNREIMNGGPAWGESPVWEEQSPSTYASQFSTPMLLTIGEKDFRVPVNQTIAAWSYLKRMQVPGRLLVFHDANHWVMKGEEARYYWKEMHEWLAKYLLDPPEEQASFEVSSGGIDGALYTIATPQDWNGKLLLIAHGHRFTDRDLDASLNFKRPYLANLLADGWMVATSSYRRNGIIVREAIEDLGLLRQHIVKQFGKPKRTLLIGNSMGGAIGTIISETNPQDYDGVIAIGAALRVLESREPYELSYQPKIPLLFLTNQSELEDPEQYVSLAKGSDMPPMFWPVARDGHVNVNDAEREAAIRALDGFLDTGEIDRNRDGTIAGTMLESTAEFTDEGAISTITSVSRVFGNFFTGFVEEDLDRLGLSRGQAFQIRTRDSEFNALWGSNYRDVGPGEWVAFISAEGNLMVARNTESACQAINCNIGDRLLLRPAKGQ